MPIIARPAIEMSTPVDSNVRENESRIISELSREEIKFKETLERGEKLLNEMLQEAEKSGLL